MVSHFHLMKATNQIIYWSKSTRKE